MQMARTKDEKFIIATYEKGLKQGDIYGVQNRYEVGRSCGIAERGVNAICNQLARANFIRKLGENEMVLTKNGEALALRLLRE